MAGSGPEFGPEAAMQSKGDSTKIAYALLQEQVSLERSTSWRSLRC